MLTQDAALQIAYAERPDMLLRLAEFAVGYVPQSKPALLVQASPDIRGLEVDLSGIALQAALRHGNDRQHAWWGGLHAPSELQPVFRGLACQDSREAPRWACEMHRDGSVIAGVWTFPEGGSGSDRPCLHDFYVGFFDDFVEKALRLTADLAQPYRLTATLLQASALPFATSSYGGWQGTAAAPRLDTLQWPLRLVSAPEHWRAAATLMNAELFGAYGQTLPAPRRQG
ncbi:hypothetical protein ACU4GI_11505 [Cupriavidus basilensis]